MAMILQGLLVSLFQHRSNVDEIVVYLKKAIGPVLRNPVILIFVLCDRSRQTIGERLQVIIIPPRLT